MGPKDQQIRQLAYKKWEEAGHPTGDGVNFWLEAETELKQIQSNTLAADQPKGYAKETQMAAKQSVR